MQYKLRPLAALATLALSATAAQATDGYFQHGYGVKSQGMGGVGIALPQDGLAAATNPAGTAFVGDRLDVGATWFRPNRGADIVGNGMANGSYDGNGKSDFLIPELGLVKQISPSVAAGVAIYANGGMNTSYQSGVPLFGSGEAGVNLEQLFVSPNLAWKLNENHAFGVAANLAYQRFEAKGLQNFGLTNAGVDTSIGAGVRFGYTGNVTPALTVGATWASKINASKFSKYSGLFADSGNFDIPENYGIGLAYRATPALTVAADVSKILYSRIDSIGNSIANFSNGFGAPNGPGFGWRDVTVYKLGVAYDVSSSLTLRTGYNHSTQPIPAGETLFNILAPGVVQDHLSVGGTYKVSKTGEWSFAYTHAFKKTVNGVNAIPQGFGAGNANLHLSEDVFGVAYGWKF